MLIFWYFFFHFSYHFSLKIISVTESKLITDDLKVNLTCFGLLTEIWVNLRQEENLKQIQFTNERCYDVWEAEFARIIPHLPQVVLLKLQVLTLLIEALAVSNFAGVDYSISDSPTERNRPRSPTPPLAPFNYLPLTAGDSSWLALTYVAPPSLWRHWGPAVERINSLQETLH